MLYVVIGVVIGVFVGFKTDLIYNPNYAVYISLAILAIINSISTILYDSMKKESNIKRCLILLIVDFIFAMFFVYIGERLKLPLYLAAIFAFGNNIYINIKNMIIIGVGKKKL